MRKILTSVLLTWALWWVQDIPAKPELPWDVVKLSVHETREACEERAATRRQWEADLYKQEVAGFAWEHKPWPKYMLRTETFTCIPA